ncbi:hypothetical protein [Methylobacterium iners]|uniref:Uncharacterized protein n=1 Tax=Methylobacterium iners TaxID=418707 RepID=A0ABQ4S2V2_9HYPH|nr:hypothetical protein [Methylobacterium iners]GJD96778.1 hypothetical protein OCOJLMKI_4003 [Methylobacterium iners]
MAGDASGEGEDSRDAEPPRYRVLILSQEGQPVEIIGFTAYGDDAASAIAKSMVDGHAIELWCARRLVGRFEPEGD